jgi:hypothetical protein
MKVRFLRIGYACTPVFGQKPVFTADVEINRKPHELATRADDVFEAAHAICTTLGIPISGPVEEAAHAQAA